MRRVYYRFFALCTLIVFGFSGRLRADVFNMPAGQASVSFVTVGDAGNVSDSGRGSVSYVYAMDKYDVTAAQYTQFLNSVATTDTYGLYDPEMFSKSAAAGIIQSGGPGSYTYSVMNGHENFPVNFVSWGSAARFSNWLQNGQPSGPEGVNTTETGAYTLNGAVSDADLITVSRNPNAHYFIPTADEWYKSAFYKGGGLNSGYWTFATHSDSTPSNVLSTTGTNNANCDFADRVNFLTSVGFFAASPSAYGTFDQNGDVFQWNEAIKSGDTRALFGGAFGSPAFQLASSLTTTGSGFAPTARETGLGFRIAALVPEPTSSALIVVGLLTLIAWDRRRPKGI